MLLRFPWAKNYEQMNYFFLLWKIAQHSKNLLINWTGPSRQEAQRKFKDHLAEKCDRKPEIAWLSPGGG